jgi:hypothetical protein
MAATEVTRIQECAGLQSIALCGEKNESEVHVSIEVGRAVITAGLAVEIPPDVKKSTPDTAWNVCEGQHAEHPPYIHARCATCGTPAYCGGPNATKMKFLHCGVVETVPRDIAKHYERELSKWEKGAPKDQYHGVTATQIQIEQKRMEALGARRRPQQ